MTSAIRMVVVIASAIASFVRWVFGVVADQAVHLPTCHRRTCAEQRGQHHPTRTRDQASERCIEPHMTPSPVI